MKKQQGEKFQQQRNKKENILFYYYFIVIVHRKLCVFYFGDEARQQVTMQNYAQLELPPSFSFHPESLLEKMGIFIKITENKLKIIGSFESFLNAKSTGLFWSNCYAFECEFYRLSIFVFTNSWWYKLRKKIL